MELSLALKDTGEVLEVSVSGEIDIASAPRLDEMLAIARLQRPDSLVVSLRDCDYCDSTGMSVLIRHAKAVRRFRLVIPKESRLRRVFEIANLVRELGVVETLADATPKQRMRVA